MGHFHVFVIVYSDQIQSMPYTKYHNKALGKRKNHDIYSTMLSKFTTFSSFMVLFVDFLQTAGFFFLTYSFRTFLSLLYCNNQLKSA